MTDALDRAVTVLARFRIGFLFRLELVEVRVAIRSISSSVRVSSFDKALLKVKSTSYGRLDGGKALSTSFGSVIVSAALKST